MKRRGRTRREFLGVLGAGVVGSAAGCTAPVGTQPAGAPAEPTATPDAVSPYTRAYREAVDSVVRVQAVGPARGQGSGFRYEGGHVVTNQHVVGAAERVDLRFARGEWRAAAVLGTDSYSDLAVLAVPDRPAYATALPLLTRPPPIGTEVVAIGSPFGLEKSLSAGVVSGVGRSIPTRGGFTIADAVQTDAAVNPGNSGGPLVTLDGEAVGVIRSGGGDNIGFAISAALVQRIAPALATRGRYRHPYLGVGILDVSPVVAQANGLEAPTGVLVERVLEDGPADGVLQGSDDATSVNGVRVPVGGDVIVAMDGDPIPSSSALGRHLALETRPGQTVPVRIIRAGTETSIDVTLGARPPP